MKISLLPAYLIPLTLLLISGLQLSAQVPRYLISFTDKHNSPYRLDAPSGYLSERALQRRTRHQISIDSTDLPVNPAYIDSILKAGNVQLVYTLRWTNQAVIRTSDAEALQKIQELSFVKDVHQNANRMMDDGWERMEPIITAPARRTGTQDIDYGSAYTQIHLHEGEYLHNRSMKGDGMMIAVFDAGFLSVNNSSAFSWLRDRQKIIATRNFTDNTADVYSYDDHGTHCLSILAANLPGEMTGTAPEAAYVLLRTEEQDTEQPIEEVNWAAGAELADSLGVDVISSSLGYNTFDDPDFNHTYAQMDGHSLAITRAADMAAAKGMIVVNSAGNEGNLNWRYLLAPADGDSVLTVGAVSSQRQVASFSSYGPAADGRVKPDVAGLGVGTSFITSDGSVGAGNGTSYACPVVAGLVACLWQAFPRRSNMEILQAVKASASRYTSPDNRMGYGIPNFRAAYDTLLRQEMADSTYIREQLAGQVIKVFPNPFTTRLNIYYQSTSSAPVHLQLIDGIGRVTRNWTAANYGNYGYFTWETGLEQLPTGIYYLRMVQGNTRQVVKLMKW
ncbi:MAG TPA: S8 family serine peptidase [Chitinophaga sp.]